MRKKMNLYKSPTYIEDLKAVIAESPWLNRFEEKSFLITGATGLICSSMIDLLLFYNEQYDANIKVYAAGRDREKVNERFFKFYGQPSLEFLPYDASKSNTFGMSVDYIIHGASNAYPAVVQKHPIETMQDNFSGMFELLEFAAENPVSNAVLISSSEIYGRKESPEPFKEDEYGFIDLLNPRSAYSVGKRAAETLCASFACEKNVPVSIVRPGHIYGPTAGRTDNRISSSFAYDAAEGRDLVLKSDGSQIRSYCYMLDCATAILKVALDGKSVAAYNISNPASVMSIKEIASFYAEYGAVHLQFQCPTDREKAAFNPMQNSSLNSDRLQALGWKGLFDSKTGTEHTVRIIKEAQV